jgi:glycosyltransferase involved in cell wall biosynthesis
VIPTLNEAENLEWVLEHLPSWVSEVVLVDGLSVDHTERVARKLRTDVIVVHQPQKGKGAALRAGFAAATKDIVVMIDADGSTNPQEMDRFVKALQDGAEFVKGTRHGAGGGSEDITYIRRAGNLSFVKLVNLMYGSKFTDLCYGYCAFWRSSLDALALTADGFEIETQLVLNAVKAGLKIEEVPSIELSRRAGVSNLNAVRDGLRVLGTIMDERPGRDDRRTATSSEIILEPVQLPAPGDQSWRPAGSERRREDRRELDRVASGYTGPERRHANRRRQPRHTVTVYRVVERPAEEIAIRLAA